MKEELCRAFCESLHVVEVPAGFAFTTAFQGLTGEPLMFYAVRLDGGFWQVQDDGTTVPYLEAAGADLTLGARAETLAKILSAHGAYYNEEAGELIIGPIEQVDIPPSALRFISLMLRVQELLQTTKEKAEAVWIEEATRGIESALHGRASIHLDSPVFADLKDWPADVVVKASGRAPVAVYFGTNNTKAYEALLLHATARYQMKKSVVVVLLLENERALTQKIRQRADNSLVVPRFRGAEADAIGRIAEEALGERPEVVH